MMERYKWKKNNLSIRRDSNPRPHDARRVLYRCATSEAQPNIESISLKFQVQHPPPDALRDADAQETSDRPLPASPGAGKQSGTPAPAPSASHRPRRRAAGRC